MILFHNTNPNADDWWTALRAQFPASEIARWPALADPNRIEFAILSAFPPDLPHLPQLKAISAFGAGVDQLLDGASYYPGVAVARVVDGIMVERMRDYVACQVLHFALRMDVYDRERIVQRWAPLGPFDLSDTRVLVLGLGHLGEAVARRCTELGTQTAGWSRSKRQLANVECFAGVDGLDRALQRSDIVVCLLPLTPATRGLLNAKRFSSMPPGSVVINVARGGLLDEADLKAALLSHHLRGACLDVFDREPLPPDNSLWTMRGIRLTPHVSSYSRPSSAAPLLAEQYQRLLHGEPLLHQIDLATGY